MDVSIIIVNYNTKDLISNCLKSIFEQTAEVKFEIIVVDNASYDGSQKMINTIYPKIILIESKENLGFGRANNIGVENAKGKYLFFLNSDTILLNNAIKYFFEFFESHPDDKFGAAGSLLLDKDLNPTHSSGRFPSKRKTLKEIFLGYIDRTCFSKYYNKEKLIFDNEFYFETDYITGADLFISRDLFIRINGFDASFFMYYEDTDLQKRIGQLKLKRIIINGPKIIHIEGGSNKYAIFSIHKRIMVTQSMFLYFQKYSAPFNYCLFRVCYFLIRTPIFFDKRISFRDRIKYLFFLMKG